VKTQIWTAVSDYVLIAIIKKRPDLDASLYALLQVFSVSIFEKTPLNQGFFDGEYSTDDPMFANQLKLFDS